MQKYIFRSILSFCFLLIFQHLFAQVTTNSVLLRKAAVVQQEKEKILAKQLAELAKKRGWETVLQWKNGGIALLTGVDGFGNPIYTATDNNTLAAATIGTNALWNGGILGLNLSGSSNNVKDKMAVWDGGRVRSTHVELTGRILQKDGAAVNSDHATHVSGTLIASGVNPYAKGMSFGLQRLLAYDFNSHLSEMLNESPNLLISNHSYGTIAGWNFNATQNRWEFYGRYDATEDYKFGYYSSDAQLFDSIAYNAPYYLIVKSAGNNRSENGPAVGATYWRFDINGSMTNAGARPGDISSNDGFDIISTYGTSKNILTVGAVNPIASGYTRPTDVVISSFSSWGPTDDGRIKPDVVADGVGLLSSVATTDNAYSSLSGTSMASPNTSGSLLLLQEYYSQLNGGNFMRAATLKGLVIHTADEAGFSPGPDYQFGWGLVNIKKAAQVIALNNSKHLILEQNLTTSTTTYSLPVVASGNGQLSATISWTDPKSEIVEPVATALNNQTIKLVNDLDIVIKKGSTVYRPWILDPGFPAGAASKGNNIRDNVEKVEVTDVVPGETYTIEVTFKGTLARGAQAFSLLVSGIGGTAYCSSASTNTAGARIDSVSFSNIQNKNVAGCTSYSNFTNFVGNVQSGQTIPFFARLNSCDASSTDKVLKIFIDANNDGDFADAGELLATSSVINGNGDYTGNIGIPAGIGVGNYCILRVVMVETNDASSVTSCNSYTKGETQDYRVLITTPSTDVGINRLVSPQPGDCSSNAKYVTVNIRNYGNSPQSNIPLTVTIKQGATTVATLSATFSVSIPAFAEKSYTFQTPFEALPGITYTITANAALAGDQDASNNENITQFNVSAGPSTLSATAVICENNVLLNAAPTNYDLYTWYTSANATTPVATGYTANISTIASTYYLGINEEVKIGPATKQVFADGGYNVFNGNLVRITAEQATTLQTVRLYIGHPGRITFHLRELASYNETTGAYSYFPVSSVSLDVTATALTPPVLGAQNNSLSDQGAIYYLGLTIPKAGNYALVIQCENGASIFRNNNITSMPYPYTIPGLLSITGNSAIQAGSPDYFQGFYYFLYDLTVKPLGCGMPRRAITPTTINKPVISVSGNILTSTASQNYQWFKDGVGIPSANSQSYSATSSGSYTVQTLESNCILVSTAVNFVTTAINNVDPSTIGLLVTPNPTITGKFTIQLVTKTKDDLTISLLNTVGQQVFYSNTPQFIGRLTKQIDPGKLPAGIYYLQIRHDKKYYTKRIMITQ
ncbi:S8 family serine peptidase [Lacibacter sp. H375]|uniref:S8 family serine peptidase n=1 Tax=Lacibacter sp. H375 TaxID=3133424 RepID=UPI0030BAB2F2